MALTWEQTKALIRAKAVADELMTAARRASDRSSVQRSAAAGRNIDALVEQVRGVLAQADTPDLVGEFDAMLAGAEGGASAVEARAAAVLGWLEGVVEAESFEMRLREEAAAYAEARVRAERPVGFAQPGGEDEAAG